METPCVYDQCPGGIQVSGAGYEAVNGIYRQTYPSCDDMPNDGTHYNPWEMENGAHFVWHWDNETFDGWGIGHLDHHRYYDGQNRNSPHHFVTDDYVTRSSFSLDPPPSITCLQSSHK